MGKWPLLRRQNGQPMGGPKDQACGREENSIESFSCRRTFKNRLLVRSIITIAAAMVCVKSTKNFYFFMKMGKVVLRF